MKTLVTRERPVDVIYVLEDEDDLAELYRRTLHDGGFAVELFSDIESFVAEVERQEPALCLLDLSLPDGDGLIVLKTTLANNRAPVIIASGRGGLGDKLIGLESGADDYIVKPIEPLELLARVKSVLRRSRPQEAEEQVEVGRDVAIFGEWQVNFSTFELTGPGPSADMLSQADIQLLRVLVKAPGRVLSRDFLMEACGPQLDDTFDRTIDVRISRLRKKLKDDPKSPKIVKTVYGAGYVFAPKVVWAATS